jgi:hypothetical protein
MCSRNNKQAIRRGYLMAQTKIITPGSQEFHEPIAQLVKFSSRGLIGGDLRDFVKRASARFTHKIASMSPMPGEILIHLLAVGATEAYGPNRNGDGFKEATCRQCHPSFMKFARWYRDHQNKDTTKGRGMIRGTDFNPEMRRIELLVGLNETKEAADRNHGLVADLELEKLNRGEDIPVSMACKVAYDECSGCGNKAKTRADYCGPEMCKYGGCKDNLAKTFEDGHTLHVENPNAMFFDISDVYRNADRIAFTTGFADKLAEFKEMQKAAGVIYGADWGGAALAERFGVSAPLWLATDGPWTDPKIVGQLKIASALIQLEEEMEKIASDPVDLAFSREIQQHQGELPEGRYKLAHVMAALAENRCLLPLDAFVQLMSGGSHEKNAAAAREAAQRLPGIFARMADDPCLEENLRKNPYLPAGAPASGLRDWAMKCAKDWSLERSRVVERLQRATLRGVSSQPRPPLVKVAAVDKTEELATQYAMYQLAALHSMASAEDQEFRNELAIRSNHRAA